MAVDLPPITPLDHKLAYALIHDADVMLTGSSSTDLGHDEEIVGVARTIKLAAKLLAGKATDEDRALVPELVHPQVRSLYL